ncbi:MAG: HNH endonuclease signature motif containing protein [Comamonas sp.]
MALTKSQRAKLREKYDGRCAYCGCELGDKWHADHIEAIDRQWWKPGSPAAKPELDTLENMNPSCPPCNIDKHSMSLESWRGVMQRSNEVLVRDVSTFRRAVRYGLVTLNAEPIVFYFEKLVAQAKGED